MAMRPRPFSAPLDRRLPTMRPEGLDHTASPSQLGTKRGPGRHIWDAKMWEERQRARRDQLLTHNRQFAKVHCAKHHAWPFAEGPRDARYAVSLR